jgi:phage-related protein
MFNVTFVIAKSGRSYFEKFIGSLPKSDRALILAVFQEISNKGLRAKGCDFRQIESKLWEIKIRTPSGGYRFFYVMLSSSLLLVLHQYKKQGLKAPQRELEVARRRMKEALL